MRLEVTPPLVGFVDDDAGYLAWIAEHPGGYVVNTTRSPHADYLTLHRASCRHVSGDDGRHWTRQYVKICGPSAELLDGWTAKEVGGEAARCSFCVP